jgi:KTSC domain-containing protein
MRLKPVDSEMLRLVGYDARARVLEVVFNTGGQYQYKEVPASEYEKLMSAESIGQYMHRYIIDRYDYERIN